MEELYEEACSCAMWLEKEWEKDPATIENEIYLNTIREFRLLSAFRTDSPQLEECLKNVAKIYLDRDVSDYSLKGIDPNFKYCPDPFLCIRWHEDKKSGMLTEFCRILLLPGGQTVFRDALRRQMDISEESLWNIRI